MDFYMRDYNHQTTVYSKIKSYALGKNILILTDDNNEDIKLNLDDYLDWFTCDYIGD